MKAKKLVLFIAISVSLIISSNLPAFVQSPIYPVNPIIGDISFINEFGYLPDNNTDENLRIKTHLSYVEKILRSKNTTEISKELLEKRNHILDLLHEYIAAGVFPKNYDLKDQRIPCFIDKDGNICAVGYLIEKTAGREIAEEVNSNHKYHYIFEMNDAGVDNWIESSGLTEEECAMIQPQYFYESVNSISTTDVVISTSLTTVNLTFNTLNAVQLSSNNKNTYLPTFGLLTGVSQIVFGAASYPDKRESYQNYEAKQVLSIANIGIGASTVILSVINLLTNKKPEQKKTSWNIYNYPVKDELGIGVSFNHKF